MSLTFCNVFQREKHKRSEIDQKKNILSKEHAALVYGTFDFQGSYKITSVKP